MNWIRKAIRFLTGPWPATAFSGIVWLVILLNIFGALRTPPEASGASTAPSHAAGTRAGAVPPGLGKYVAEPNLLAKVNASPVPAPSAPAPALVPRQSESALQAKALYNQEFDRLAQMVPLIDPGHSFAFDQQFFDDVMNRKKGAQNMGASQIDALRVALREACRAEIEIIADCIRIQSADVRCIPAQVRAFHCSEER